MARRTSKTQGKDRETSPRGAFVPITADIRKLATEVAKDYDEISSGKPGYAEPRPGTDNQFVVVVGEIILVIKTTEDLRDPALLHLAELGRVKNKHFSSSKDDLVRRQSEYEKIYQLRHTNRPLWQLYHPVQIGRTLSVKSFIRRQVPMPPKFDEDVLKFPALIDPVVEEDPLEEPALLLGKNDPESELLIFLEHYLPQDLAEVARNLADTNRDYCPLSSKSLALLSAFNRCYQSFPVIRTSLLLPDRSISKFLDDAHDRLLNLIQLVLDASLTTLPHKLAIHEADEHLVFKIDDTPVDLTVQQRESLVALAVLVKNSKFSSKVFTDMVGLRGKVEQNVINRLLSLKRAALPLLEYEFNKGTCTLRGLQFVGLPSEHRLMQEF